MDIASFVLGMCSVVVVSSLAVTVISLVKIRKTIKEIDNNLECAQQNISELSRALFSGLDENRNEMDTRFDDAYRFMDSRLDKIMSKIRMIEADFYHRKSKDPSIPLGPSDVPAYPGYDYDTIKCTDNTNNQ